MGLKNKRRPCGCQDRFLCSYHSGYSDGVNDILDQLRLYIPMLESQFSKYEFPEPKPDDCYKLIQF